MSETNKVFKLTVQMESGRIHEYVSKAKPTQAAEGFLLLAGDGIDLEVNISKIESIKSEVLIYEDSPSS